MGSGDFFGILKGRLSLENFTGLSAESVRQDFWPTILISNYETILTFDINQELNENRAITPQGQKVNKAVAFNIIKHQAFNILFNNAREDGIEVTIQRLRKLFKTAAIPNRERRNPPRRLYSGIRSYNFLLRKKKHAF